MVEVWHVAENGHCRYSFVCAERRQIWKECPKEPKTRFGIIIAHNIAQIIVAAVQQTFLLPLMATDSANCRCMGRK